MINQLDRRRIAIFIALSFGIAWATAGYLQLNGGLIASPVLIEGTNITLALALIAGVYMFAPALAHILTRRITNEGWKDANLKLNFAGQRWTWLTAWFLPGTLVLLGAAIYFLIFPDQFDAGLGTLAALIEGQGAQIDLDLKTIAALQLAQGLLLAPIINGIFTFGEEFGWRAYLQPKLMALGFRRAMLSMGLIWGLWHAPVIAMGHNYGFGYWGYPWTGFLGMIWFTLTGGIVIGWLALKGRSVWPAVIAHAAVNGIASAGALFLSTNATPNPLLGPLPVGIIGNIPWTLFAAYLFWKRGELGPVDVSRETFDWVAHNPTPESVIFARGLTKHFGDITAVENLDLDIPAGEVFGLLGPNGAGKTTTIRMLTALIAPNAGGAQIAGYRLGEDDQQIRKAVGILTESPGMYEQISAERNLAFYADMYEVEEVDKQVKRYLQMLGLWDRKDEPVGTFSKGMRQKLAIARALLHEPRVLYLDEPTSGLDPEAAKLVREFIEELRVQGRTIVLTTHNLDEADRLCDRIAVFKTSLLAVDTPTNLRRSLFGRSVVFHLSRATSKHIALLNQKSFVSDVKKVENKLIATIDDPEKRNPIIINELVQAGAKIQFVGEIRQSLEDVYLQLINNEMTER
jgi:ABC-2 type transport system ATP-binding protein